MHARQRTHARTCRLTYTNTHARRCVYCAHAHTRMLHSSHFCLPCLCDLGAGLWEQGHSPVGPYPVDVELSRIRGARGQRCPHDAATPRASCCCEHSPAGRINVDPAADNGLVCFRALEVQIIVGWCHEHLQKGRWRGQESGQTWLSGSGLPCKSYLALGGKL